MGDFGRLAGLKLNIKKSKAIWLGKWEKNKSYPLQLKWLHSPTRLLGIHVSYDEKGNNELNFNLKIRKLQTKLDMWRSRDLTLFGKVLIIKSLGLSQLIYSASKIVEFVSGGAKNYGYRTRRGKTECKVRGFTLNYETLHKLNYEPMKANILKELDGPLQERRQIAIEIQITLTVIK